MPSTYTAELDQLLGLAFSMHSPRQPYAMEPQLDERELRAVLTRVRADGYAVAAGYIHPDATAVAVPIRGPYGNAVASFAVVVPSEGFHVQPVLQVLIPAAHAVGSALKNSLMGQQLSIPGGLDYSRNTRP